MLHNVFTYCKALGCYIMYSPIARSVVLRRRNRTIINLFGNIFFHNAARSKLSPQMAEPCKEHILVFLLTLVATHTSPLTICCFFHKWSVIFKWIGALSNSIWKSHTLCPTLWLNLPQEGVGISCETVWLANPGLVF